MKERRNGIRIGGHMYILSFYLDDITDLVGQTRQIWSI
jgi:hypothetical protein